MWNQKREDTNPSVYCVEPVFWQAIKILDINYIQCSLSVAIKYKLYKIICQIVCLYNRASVCLTVNKPSIYQTACLKCGYTTVMRNSWDFN